MRLPLLGVWISSCFGLASTLVAPAAPAQEVVEDYSWARQHLAECTNQLLGSHEDLVRSPFATTAVATVRTLQDACGERQLSLVQKVSDELEVHVAQVIGEPILEQLFALHEGVPAEDAERLCAKIPVKTDVLEGAQAEKLRPHLEELHKQGFSLLPENLGVVHGSIYSIQITSGQWRADISFPDTRDPAARHSLAAWAEAVLAAADLSCGSARPSLEVDG
jgi:hypothetical protein